LLEDDLPREIDVTIDGADEVSPELHLIKGGGGALLREEIVAESSLLRVYVVDDSKLSTKLGVRKPVPVEADVSASARSNRCFPIIQAL
jgi:ribose 5-phosphate isomerase A